MTAYKPLTDEDLHSFNVLHEDDLAGYLNDCWPRMREQCRRANALAALAKQVIGADVLFYKALEAYLGESEGT